MSNFNHQLVEKEFELSALQKENADLKKKNDQLEKDFADLKSAYYLTFKSDKGSKNLCDTIDILESEAKKSKEDLKENERTHMKAVRDMQFRYEKEINSLKNITENTANKLDGIKSLEVLCSKQQQRIIDLEEELKQLSLDNKEQGRQKQIQHDMKFTELKKKMMDHIKQTQKNVTDLNIKHMDVSTKLTILQNHQLLIELEHQSHQIEDLLKKKALYEKTILELKKDLDVQKEVQNVFAEKNKKYAEMIKNLTNKSNNLNDSFVRNNESFVDINKQIREFNFNSYSDKKMRQLEISLRKKETEYEILKINYDSLFDKLTVLEKKFASVYSLFEVGLQKMQDEEELKNSKEVYVNIDELKSCDFSSLSVEQKYSVLMILLKHILPNLLENENMDVIKTNLKNIKMKYHVKMSTNANSSANTNAHSHSLSRTHFNNTGGNFNTVSLTRTHTFFNKQLQLNKSSEIIALSQRDPHVDIFNSHTGTSFFKKTLFNVSNHRKHEVFNNTYNNRNLKKCII